MVDWGIPSVAIKEEKKEQKLPQKLQLNWNFQYYIESYKKTGTSKTIEF